MPADQQVLLRVWSWGEQPQLQSLVQDFPLDSVDDSKWDSVRFHPCQPEYVIICRFQIPVAIARRQWAAAVRQRVLLEWKSARVTVDRNEFDVASAITSRVCTLGRGSPTSFVKRYLHVWLPWDSLLPVPRSCLAFPMPPRGAPNPFHPAVSAFTPVSKWGSPLNAAAFKVVTARHPLQSMVVCGLQYGVSLLASPPHANLFCRDTGLDAAATVMRPVVQKELDDGAFIRVERASAGGPTPVRMAPFYGIPKPDGSARGICNLSLGNGCKGQGSVNSLTRRGVSVRARLMTLPRLLNRILFMKTARPGVKVLIMKLDVRRGFRTIPVPQNQFWCTAHLVSGALYFDTRSIMGACNAGDGMSVFPTVMADWSAVSHGIWADSYVDDYVVLAYEDEAPRIRAIQLKLWDFVQLPVSVPKLALEGDFTSTKTILGVEIDTVGQTVCVHVARQAKLIALLELWLSGCVKPSPQHYARLAGSLQFISALIPCGRAFLSSFYLRAYGRSSKEWRGDARASHGLPDSYTLPSDVKHDLSWWKQALVMFNRSVSFAHHSVPTSVITSTDASGIGYGCWYPGANECCYGPWLADEVANSVIAHREGVAVWFAACLWGPAASGSTLIVMCDSMACVLAFNGLRASCPRMRLIMNALALVQVHCRFRLVLCHLPGVLNVVADALSRKLAIPSHLLPQAVTVRPLHPSIRALGGLLQCLKLRRQNLDRQLRERLYSTLVNIVRTHTTPSLAQLHWTPLSNRPMDLQEVVACSTLLAGSGCSNHSSQPTQCPITSPLFVRTSTSLLDGSSRLPLSSNSICIESDRCPGAAISNPQSPLP